VIYLKSTLTGLVAAVMAGMLWILVTFVLPIVAPMLIARMTGQGGAAGAVIDSNSILVAAAVGFVVGFFWRWCRLRRAEL
jgi:hypothetical protein